MSEKTLTRMDLSEAVFREVGLSRNESAQLVESVLRHMSDALASGETVKIVLRHLLGAREKLAHGAQSEDRRGSADQPAPRALVPALAPDEGSRRGRQREVTRRPATIRTAR